MNNQDTAVLLISCADQRGIVAAVTRFLHEKNGNILHLDEHVDEDGEIFLMRAEWSLAGFSLNQEKFQPEFQEIADSFKMNWSLHYTSQTPRMALFVSKQLHCLYDLLSRRETSELNVEIPLIISNHLEMAQVAKRFDLPFHHFPISKENKLAQEQKQIALLKENKVDFIVLARYMQILSKDFIDHFPNRIINIHHSFLPAFPGAKPYHSAHTKGVKIIGATSHYVTEELDQGPIIEQDVARVSHRESVQDFIRRGAALEKMVLGRAVWWHLQHRILVYTGRT